MLQIAKSDRAPPADSPCTICEPGGAFLGLRKSGLQLRGRGSCRPLACDLHESPSLCIESVPVRPHPCSLRAPCPRPRNSELFCCQPRLRLRPLQARPRPDLLEQSDRNHRSVFA